MTEFEIDPWAASDGLPEVADDESYADGVREKARDRDTPWALPPDREDGPMALDEFGITSAQRQTGEPLAGRLSRELPEVGSPSRTSGGGNARTGEEQEQEAPDEQADRVQAQDAEDPGWDDEIETINPQLGSTISTYDRPVSGIDERVDIGALIRPGSGYSSFETNEIADDLDVGASLGGLGGEELAIHEIATDETELEEAQSTSEPYVDPRERAAWPVFRTGADQEWDPEDLAVAEGHDPTPGNIERARLKLEELGPAAIERTVP